MINASIDDWLASLGMDTATQDTTVNRAVLPETLASESPSQGMTPAVQILPPQEPQPPLSDEDFNEILYENGISDASRFNVVVDVQAEEITEETEEDAVPEERGGEEVVTNEASPQTPSETEEPPLLPLNSPTLLMDNSTSRFSGTEWYNKIQEQNITVAGIGGIGSNLAFQLARLHPHAIFLYDDDIVETANMSGQLFSHESIGRHKSDAIASIIYKFTTLNRIYANTQRYTETSIANKIMMCGFDNMEARNTFFQSWVQRMIRSEEERKEYLYVDGRLSIDTLQILCIRGDDTYNINRYKQEFLFSDEEADATVCSMKQTTYMACMIASLMTNLLVNHVANLLDPVIPYDLPFFTEYDAQNMLFKTEN